MTLPTTTVRTARTLRIVSGTMTMKGSGYEHGPFTSDQFACTREENIGISISINMVRDSTGGACTRKGKNLFLLSMEPLGVSAFKEFLVPMLIDRLP